MWMQNPENAAARLSQWAEEFSAGPANDLGRPDGSREPAYGRPLLGHAAGDDPLWARFKDVVHPEHWTPVEAFNLAFPDERAEPAQLSVVSWIFPQTAATRRDQRANREFPAERWVRSRWHGQHELVEGLGRLFLQRFQEAGLQALLPDTLPDWRTLASERYHIASKWSHRHAAFAAGLGTFGLCDGLISPAGKALRANSLVVRLKLPASPRSYSEPHEHCLFYNSDTCGQCIKRCPAGALSPAGHDKKLCAAYLEKTKVHIAAHWPDQEGKYACGLCQTGIPCESRIPPRPKSK